MNGTYPIIENKSGFVQTSEIKGKNKVFLLARVILVRPQKKNNKRNV